MTRTARGAHGPGPAPAAGSASAGAGAVGSDRVPPPPPPPQKQQPRPSRREGETAAAAEAGLPQAPPRPCGGATPLIGMHAPPLEGDPLGWPRPFRATPSRERVDPATLGNPVGLATPLPGHTFSLGTHRPRPPGGSSPAGHAPPRPHLGTAQARPLREAGQDGHAPSSYTFRRPRKPRPLRGLTLTSHAPPDRTV